MNRKFPSLKKRDAGDYEKAEQQNLLCEAEVNEKSASLSFVLHKRHRMRKVLLKQRFLSINHQRYIQKPKIINHNQLVTHFKCVT